MIVYIAERFVKSMVSRRRIRIRPSELGPAFAKFRLPHGRSLGSRSRRLREEEGKFHFSDRHGKFS